MRKVYADTVVIGGGAAGLAAAIKLKDLSVNKVILVDDRERLGGILPQCIHTGFGVHYSKRDLTGPEFAEELSSFVLDRGVDVFLNSYALELRYVDYYEKSVIVASRKGLIDVRTRTVIVATGARERTVYEIGIFGDRPAGVYTAGMVQALMDLYGVMPGKEVVIVGSGDVGLIVARRLAMQGATVKAVIEVKPWPGGLIRNIVQCLEDFGIPLLLSHAVRRIVGHERVERVIVTKVDDKLSPIPNTEFEIKCDTVVIAAGLKPEVQLLERAGALIDPVTGGPVVNEYLETSLPGVFVAGNALVINDLVDTVAEQGETAAEGAVLFMNDKLIAKYYLRVICGSNVRFIVPQVLMGLKEEITLYGRVIMPMRRAVIRIPELMLSMQQAMITPAEIFKVNISERKISKVVKLHKLTINVLESR